MLIKICVGLLLANIVLVAQTIQPSERRVEHFEVRGASRLAALAKLGSLSNTSLLVEVDSIPELQTPVSFSIDHTTVSAVARRLLPEEYVFRDVGSLLIISPRAGARNRILTLSLGSFALHPTGFRARTTSSIHHRACHRLQAQGIRVGRSFHGPRDAKHLVGGCDI